MSYPMKEVYDVFRNSSPTYREMIPQEYEKELNFYRKQAETCILSSARRVYEYGQYLKCWFSEEPCDGMEGFTMRYRLHKLPMSANTYMFE